MLLLALNHYLCVLNFVDLKCLGKSVCLGLKEKNPYHENVKLGGHVNYRGFCTVDYPRESMYEV